MSAPIPCGVCLGKPLASGRECICGGIGTEDAEMHGLRVHCFDLSRRVEELEGAMQEAIRYIDLQNAFGARCELLAALTPPHTHARADGVR